MELDKLPSGRVGNNPTPYRVLRPYDVYLTDEYCLGCAYFSQEKGHFGKCEDKKDSRVYDGAKKGTGCVLWRIKTILSPYEGIVPTVEPDVKIVWLQHKQGLGSWTHPSDIIRSKRHIRQIKSYHRIDDYSYPACEECGGRTVRVGHGYLGEQLYKCVDCGRKTSVDEVLVAQPPLKYHSRQYVAGFKPFRLARSFFKCVEHPASQSRRIVRELSLLTPWLRSLNVSTLTSSILRCRFCQSTVVVKNCLRRNKHGIVQRYKCKKCQHTFSCSQPKLSPNHISRIIILRSLGYSYRNIQKMLAKSADPCFTNHTTIMKWVHKYVMWCMQRGLS